jgi:pimeloyl-ACP methyl ester carboxylesterase
MFKMPDILWLNTSPSWQHFDNPLIRYLSRQRTLSHWEYNQTQDEASSMAIAVELLHDYFKNHNRPMHLIGHSTGGLLGLLYARQHPERVKSLTLLAVGAQPAIDWQAHYYTRRLLLPCSRQIVLAQMAQEMFGYRDQKMTKAIIRLLERDLVSSPCEHSLLQRVSVPAGGVGVPLMVCGSKDDSIVDTNALQGWQSWLKESDRLWESPQGRHFFHYFHPQPVSEQILQFWNSLPQPDSETAPLFASS